MQWIRSFGKRLFRRDDGVAAVEYAVMLALIIVVCLTAVRTIGRQSNKTFKAVRASLKTANS